MDAQTAVVALLGVGAATYLAKRFLPGRGKKPAKGACSSCSGCPSSNKVKG